MNPHSYKLFTSNIEIIKIAITYFLAESFDTHKFEEQKQIALQNPTIDENAKVFLNLGYFSFLDFPYYLSVKNESTKGFNLQIIQTFLESMVEEKFLILLPPRLNGEQRYKSGGSYAEFFYNRDLILNVICGWRFIIEKYSNSVVKIEHKNNKDDFSIGTGFYFVAGKEDIFTHLIITNKHVLEGAKEIRILLHDDTEIAYSKIVLDNNRDLGFLVLKESLESSMLNLNESLEILSEILTIGYPSIPMTKDSYQVYHKGELNSFVEDYQGNKLFLVSAKTSSGNSGSPIIDRHGLVLGILTEELFEKEQFYTKGKLPYYAGIPSEEIRLSMNENIFI